jgi:hypothetical protein
MSLPGLRRAARALVRKLHGPRTGFARSCAIGVPACISIGLNGTVCASTLVVLLVWAAFGGTLYGLTG